MFEVFYICESESHSVMSDTCDPWVTVHGSVHGILQVAIPLSREASQPRDLTQVSHIAGRFFIS